MMPKTQLVLALLSLLLTLPGSFAEPRKPVNVVFLLADDLRWDAVGFAGNRIVRTPNLDRLARRGMVFRNTFVTTAICAVSRASLFSGQYARRHGIYDFATPFSSNQWQRCYPELFRSAGYRVGFIGKFGVGNAAPTNTFEFWDGFNGQGRYFQPGATNHLTSLMGESALRFLEKQDARPFCLSVSFKAPHAQDGAPREFPPDPLDADLYTGGIMPRTPTVSEKAFQALPEFLRTSEARTRWERRFATDEMREETIRDYYRLITGMDREIGRILRRLNELGLSDNTLIVFTSDNGFYFGEHGLADKWFMHEESIRVPLLIVEPGSRDRTQDRVPPRVRDEMVLNIDIAPTLLDYAGLPIPAEMQGRSLRALSNNQIVSAWRQDWFYEHHFPYGGKIPDSEGVRTERFKYIRYTAFDPPVEQLYDLRRDRYEERNVAAEPGYQRRLDSMRRRYAELREQTR